MMRTISLHSIPELIIDERIEYAQPFLKTAKSTMDRCHPMKKHHAIRQLKENLDGIILNDDAPSDIAYGVAPKFDPHAFIQIWNSILPQAAFIWLHELKSFKHAEPYKAVTSLGLNEEEWKVHCKALYDPWDDVLDNLKKWEHEITSAARHEMNAIRGQIEIINGPNPSTLRILKPKVTARIQPPPKLPAEILNRMRDRDAAIG